MRGEVVINKLFIDENEFIELVSFLLEIKQYITIPNHNPIKIGTLNNILKEIFNQLSI